MSGVPVPAINKNEREKRKKQRKVSFTMLTISYKAFSSTIRISLNDFILNININSMRSTISSHRTEKYQIH